MFYLLAFFTISGLIVPLDDWGRDKRFTTLEACTSKRMEFQRVIDTAYLKDKHDGTQPEHVTFKCLMGPEIMAKETYDRIAQN